MIVTVVKGVAFYTFLLLMLLNSHIAIADKKITVVDTAGRSVEVKQGVARVILGEGRMMYAITLLDKEKPFERIIGWKDDLMRYDPDAFRKLRALDPKKTDSIKNFGSPYAGDFSIESAITMDSDLVILDLGGLFKAQESGVLEKLEKAGIPVVFIDFRKQPRREYDSQYAFIRARV